LCDGDRNRDVKRAANLPSALVPRPMDRQWPAALHRYHRANHSVAANTSAARDWSAPGFVAAATMLVVASSADPWPELGDAAGWLVGTVAAATEAVGGWSVPAPVGSPLKRVDETVRRAPRGVAIRSTPEPTPRTRMPPRLIRIGSGLGVVCWHPSDR